MKSALTTLVLAAALSLTTQAAPLKVYILAGQSNMEGHAQTRTFPAVAKDPKSAHLHKKMVGADGNALVHEGIPISYAYGDFGGNIIGRKHGKLTAGWGSQHHVGTGKIGPELTFGITMHELHGEPILLIKNAWGGKSLMVDFRPPSAGALPDDNKNKDKAGLYYKETVAHVKDVLADPKKAYPEYNAKDGYEIAGFVWFQGFNDMVGPYPKGDTGTKDYSEYTRLMACFIRDIRKDLNAPKMPFVIGALGVGGEEAGDGAIAFRNAMAAPAKMEDFKGNVAAVYSHQYWPDEIEAISQKIYGVQKSFHKRKMEIKKMENGDAKKEAGNQLNEEMNAAIEAALTDEEKWLRENGISNRGFHYHGSAKFFALLGEAFAKAMVELEN